MKPIILESVIIYFDQIAKFHNSLFFSGLAHEKNGERINKFSIRYLGSDSCAEKVEYSAEQSVGGESTRFKSQLLLNSKPSLENYLEINLNDACFQIRLEDVSASVGGIDNSINEKFTAYVNSGINMRLLDIGGRARSGLLRSGSFGSTSTTVLDIVPDDGVDIVADAHEMSEVLERDHFDACMSVSVFEHLLMPWKVILEINRVLKTGGLLMIATHQSIGMHDMPWDFYRYSDESWKGLLNRFTGFEILETSMSGLNYVIPFCWNKSNACSELAAGYESSVVLARKVSDTDFEWPAKLGAIVNTTYPTR